MTGAPLDVLVADDDEDSLDALTEALTHLGHTCRAAHDGDEAWKMYQAAGADVILSDWNMPGMTGIELCEKVRAAEPLYAYTHFVFITGNGENTHYLRGMQAGADDFLGKPFDLEELEARLTATQRVVTRQRHMRERNSHLRHDSDCARLAARTDSLTEAFNRLALTEDLEALGARAARYGHRYCAALCDIDDFKAYNDHFGHLAGDHVLRTVARTIHTQLRRGDVFYRYGGEEFLAVLPEQSLVEAARGMDRVRLAVENLRIAHSPAARVPFVTISVGVSLLDMAPAESMESWIGRADGALYLAKSRGRNMVVVDEHTGCDAPHAAE